MKKTLSLLIILGICILALTYRSKIETNFLGTKPTKKIASAMPEAKIAPDENLDPLRALAKNSDVKVKHLEKLSDALRLKYNQIQDGNLLLELIQTLARILKLDPKNSKALLTLAEITFDKQVFEKSAQYYQSYLEINPSDFASRARYASALIFLNRSNDAIVELNSALEDSPKYFQALAFKAIALHDLGKKEEAKSLALEALNSAPNEEAKLRLTKFFESKEIGKDKNSNKLNSEIVNNKNSNDKKILNIKSDPLVEFINNHVIISPKIVNIKEEGNTLKVLLDNFPIDQMPEFAIKSLKEKIAFAMKTSRFKNLELKDSNSEKVLLRY